MISTRIGHAIVVALAVSLNATGVHAAQGEMGTGVPKFGVYAAASGGATLVWSVENATVPFPAGCTNLVVSVATMGAEAYKIAAATLIAARISGRSVRFYAHAVRDGGCGVDYVELI